MAPSPSLDASRCTLCGGPAQPWRRRRGFTVLRCTSCDAGFVPPPAIPDDLEALYARGYFDGEHATGYPGYVADRALLERNFDERVAWIERLDPPGRRLLDVGAAYGFCVAAATQRGWDAEGLDLAEDCAEQAERLSGARVRRGDFLTADVGGPFDVVTFFDVLEHFRDPCASLRRARTLLAPGGLVVVETGDHRAPWARCLGNRWYFLDPPQHVVYFSAGSLREHLARAGFGDVRLSRPGRRVSLGNVLFKAAALLPDGSARRQLVERARRGVPGSVYLSFGDGMLVGARRT